MVVKLFAKQPSRNALQVQVLHSPPFRLKIKEIKYANSRTTEYY